jgi:hypothetical protein
MTPSCAASDPDDDCPVQRLPGFMSIVLESRPPLLAVSYSVSALSFLSLALFIATLSPVEPSQPTCALFVDLLYHALLSYDLTYLMMETESLNKSYLFNEC